MRDQTSVFSAKQRSIHGLMRAERRSGFAFAIIFLSLMAIAVLLGFLSFSSQNSVSSGAKQEARALGQDSQNGMIRIQNGVEQFFAQTGLPVNRMYAYKDQNTTALWNRPENLFGPTGTLTPPKKASAISGLPFNPAAYASTGSTGCTDAKLAAETVSITPSSGVGADCVFYITRVQTENNLYTGVAIDPDTTPATRSKFVVAYTGPIKSAVCQQINTLLWQTSLSDPIWANPTGSNWNDPKKLGVPSTAGGVVGIVDQITNTASNGGAESLVIFPSYSGVIRAEGCVVADATPTNPVNWYIKSLRKSN
jgi:hypothetical protein